MRWEPAMAHWCLIRAKGGHLKKSASSLEQLQDMVFKSFLPHTSNKTVSGDKRLNRAKGPVWHRKQQRQGIIPPAFGAWIGRPPGAIAPVMGGVMGMGPFVWWPMIR